MHPCVDILTPLDAHVLRVAPQGDVNAIYQALQLTLGDEGGQLHAVTMDADHALRAVEFILDRLSEAGDPRAAEIVAILRDHYHPNRQPSGDFDAREHRRAA